MSDASAKSEGAVFGWIDEVDERRCHERENQRLQDEHGEHLSGEDSGRQPDVEDNQFHQTKKRIR